MKLLQKNKFLIISCFIFFLFSKGFSETINFKADSMKGSMGESNNKTILEGKAWIETETIELFADKITLSGKDYDSIYAEGNVKGSYKESGFSFACETLDYNRLLELVILKTNVSIEDFENNLTATAQIVEYDKKNDVSTMQINVQINHKNSICTATLAIYKKTEKLLDLSGNPKIIRDNDTFSAQEITLNMETEEITLDGKVRGSVVEKKTKEESENQEENK